MEAMTDYFRGLERRLDCPERIRRPFLTKTRQMAEDFIQSKPDAAPQEIIDYLGEPQELAQGFLETLDPEMLERYRRRKKFLLRGCIAALVAALVCVSIWGIHLWNEPKTVEVTRIITIYE